ncbi:isoleucine--tRNA ligase, mitochondrial-like [Clavelina lepadiformis]|uniref:isoleucine--tRNA ligase, mitochondrial-like n=1 Tax=Clavelina lepadiformis TaxID=159417 RepID=UPI004041096E
MLIRLVVRSSIRFYGSKSQYSATVLLPRTTFPTRVKDISQHEQELQKICEFDDLYKWQQEAHQDNASFTLHDGPPYANGDVHVGHAVNKILKDIINRYKLLRGYRVNYRPGWDCHGLPIEIKAIKAKDFKSLGSVDIREKAKQFALKTIEAQTRAFKRWGVMADWDEQCYFTFDKSYEASELEAFYELYKRRLIYRDLKPVYWSPSSQTALAEAELEYDKNHISRSVYVTFPLCHPTNFAANGKNVLVLVWTTQPWTLPANQTLCFSPNLMYSLVGVTRSSSANRIREDCVYVLATSCIEDVSLLLDVEFKTLETFPGTRLDGLECFHPMTRHRTSRLSPSAHATADKGTGIVHTAPAYGAEDFDVAQKLDLPVDGHVDNSGCFMESAGFDLAGKFIFTSGNEAVVEILKQQNCLVLEHDYVHSYPYDWRTKKPIFIKTSRQWFIDTHQLQPKALKALGSVNFIPNSGKSSMMSQLKLRPYWCISRQRSWGVPIPVFYHKESGQVLLTEALMRHIISLVKRQGSDVWWTLPISELLPQHVIHESGFTGCSDEFERGGDILDIWFDSGVSWAVVLGNGPTSKADLYLEGKDQYNGWFQSSLLTSVGLQSGAPYHNVMVHGFTVAEGGQKMSKSLGNVVDPMVLINGGKNKERNPAYGADVLRWWVAESKVFDEIQISDRLMKDASASVQKIRLCLRFLISNLNNYEPGNADVSNLRTIDRYFLSLLTKFVAEVSTSYNEFRFSRVCRQTLNYVTRLSSLYFSVIKDRLYCDEERGDSRVACQMVLHFHSEALLKVVAPILPHLAEEVQMFRPNFSGFPESRSPFKDSWFNCDVIKTLDTTSVDNVMSAALVLRDVFISMVPSAQSLKYDVTIELPTGSASNNLKMLQTSTTSSDSELCEIMTSSRCTLLEGDWSSFDCESNQKVVTLDNDNDVMCRISIETSHLHKCPRCRKHTASSNGNLCDRCTFVLSNSWDL